MPQGLQRNSMYRDKRGYVPTGEGAIIIEPNSLILYHHPLVVVYFIKVLTGQKIGRSITAVRSKKSGTLK
jgi:hypothetical protein